MKKVAYLTLLMMLVFVSKSFAGGAAIVPAFGTFSCATGGKISAGQQGSNTLNIQGEGGAVITVSKVSGRPTLIISTDGSTGSSSSANNNSTFDITGGVMFNPVDVYLGLAPLPVSFYKGQYFWTRNNVGGSIYLIRCDADTTYTNFLLSDTQHWLNMDLGGASVQGFHLVGTGKVGPTGSLSFNNISTALRSSYNSQPEVFVLNDGDKFSIWGYVSNAFQKVTWANIVNELKDFFHGLTITFSEITGEPSSNAKLNNALNGKAPYRPATFAHLSSAATSALQQNDKLLETFDPAKHGAISGDGIDDYAAITASIAEAYAAGGGNVFIRGYNTSSTIVVPQRVTLVGASYGFANQYVSNQAAPRGGYIALLPGKNVATVRFVCNLYNDAGVLKETGSGLVNSDARHFGGARNITVYGNRSANASPSVADLNTGGRGIEILGSRYVSLDHVLSMFASEDGVYINSYDYGTGLLSSNNAQLNYVSSLSNYGNGFEIYGGDHIASNLNAGYNNIDGVLINGSGSYVGGDIWNNGRNGINAFGSNNVSTISGFYVYDNDEIGVSVGGGAAPILTGILSKGNGRDTTANIVNRSNFLVSSTAAGANITGCKSNPTDYLGVNTAQYGFYINNISNVITFAGNNDTGSATPFYVADGNNLQLHPDTGVTASHPAIKQTGLIDMNGNEFRNAKNLTFNAWATVSSVTSGILPVSGTSLVTLLISGGATITDISASTGGQPFTVIRNADSSPITFVHNTSKIRCTGGVNLVLKQYEAVTFIPIATGIWQQVGAGAVVDTSTLQPILTGTGIVELNSTGTGDRPSGIDFHADDTFTDYALHIFRFGGANGQTNIFHRGTGAFIINTEDAADFVIKTNNTSRFRALSNGNIGLFTLDNLFYGTGAVGVLGIKSATTAPTTSPVDVTQLWTADIGGVAGKAGLHIRSEDNSITTIGKNISSSGQFISTVPNGTPPLDVTSTSKVLNLNVEKVDDADLDTDATLAANSDIKFPSQKAIKTYLTNFAPLVSPSFTTPLLGAAIATSINGTSIPSNATLTTTIASGTASLGTSAITSGNCATAVSVTATGVTTSDVIDWGFDGDPTGITGYIPSTNGMLTIIAYPTANFANFKVCNNTGASVTPGAITLNFKVRR